MYYKYLTLPNIFYLTARNVYIYGIFLFFEQTCQQSRFTCDQRRGVAIFPRRLVHKLPLSPTPPPLLSNDNKYMILQREASKYATQPDVGSTKNRQAFGQCSASSPHITKVFAAVTSSDCESYLSYLQCCQ